METIHASCISINGKGVLLAGKSSVGKSDLALRLIDSGAQLVSDDITELGAKDGRLIASPPDTIAGMLEVRNIGLMRLPHISAVEVVLYVELVPESEILERLPEPDNIILLERPINKIKLHGNVTSAPAKIRAALFFSLADYGLSA